MLLTEIVYPTREVQRVPTTVILQLLQSCL